MFWIIHILRINRMVPFCKLIFQTTLVLVDFDETRHYSVVCLGTGEMIRFWVKGQCHDIPRYAYHIIH